MLLPISPSSKKNITKQKNRKHWFIPNQRIQDELIRLDMLKKRLHANPTIFQKSFQKPKDTNWYSSMDMIRNMNNPQSVRNRQLVITDEELLTGRRELPLEMAGGEGDTHVRLGQKKQTKKPKKPTQHYSWNRKLPHWIYSVSGFIFKIRFHFNYNSLWKC